MSDLAARRKAARDKEAAARKAKAANPGGSLDVKAKARRALASQALPTSWVEKLTQKQIDLLASTIERGAATPATPAVARRIRTEFLEASKASADDDVELA